MTISQPQQHSNYIVFIDESGDHSLTSIDPVYPVFCLSFCIFHKNTYIDVVTPRLRKLKFDTFGHDIVILHEHDIRKKSGAFSQLSKEPREAFMASLTDVMVSSDFTLIAIVVDKNKLISKYIEPRHPYHLAMEFGLERLHRFLNGMGEEEQRTFLICESRGKNEDKELELEHRSICDGDNYFNKTLPFDIIFIDKKCNSEGLQFADLTARPIGLSVIKPEQRNRALDILEGKYYRDGYGRKEGFGLKVFP